MGGLKPSLVTTLLILVKHPSLWNRPAKLAGLLGVSYKTAKTYVQKLIDDGWIEVHVKEGEVTVTPTDKALAELRRLGLVQGGVFAAQGRSG